MIFRLRLLARSLQPALVVCLLLSTGLALAADLCQTALVPSAKTATMLELEREGERWSDGNTRTAQRRRAGLARHMRRLEKIDRRNLMARVSPDLKNPAYQEYIEDYLGYLRIRDLKRKGVYSLLAGNPWVATDGATKAMLEVVVRKLVRAGAWVIYDADSRMAGWLRKRLGHRGIALSARSGPGNAAPGTHIVIRDPHLRLQALVESQMRILTPDSFTALALSLRGGERVVIDPNLKWNSTLKWWPALLRDVEERDLGLGSFEARRIAHPLSLTEFYARGTKMKLKIRSWKRLPYSDLADLWAYAVESRAIDQSAELGGGAVIYGSGSIDTPETVEQEYRTGYALARLGIPVATGGSSGSMHVTNTGAFDGGGISIGIPIAGRHALATERNAFTDVQTLTHFTSTYHTRLRALMLRRAFVLFQPGGGGTIRELAVALLNENSAHVHTRVIGFVEPTYYQDLFDFIRRLPLPPQVRNKFQLLDSTSDVEGAVLSVLSEDRELLEASLRLRSQPPRNTSRDPLETFIER